jgi:hypothetical protein
VTKTLSALLACLALTLAAPARAASGETINVSCSVAVDYLLNNVVAEPYRKTFNLSPGAGLVDDFSTPLRFKRFTASVAREAGNLVVAIDYFNDVGVFHNIAFNTKLVIHNNQGIESTAGSNTFSTSLGVVGNHTTNHTLTCRRA